MRKEKYTMFLMLTGIILNLILLLASADLRTRQIEDFKKMVLYLQGNINVNNKRGLYKYELLPGLEWPVREIHSANITSDYYNMRQLFNRWTWHYAIDISRKSKTFVYAARGGIVKSVKYDVFYGWTITVDHYNSRTKYCHLQETFVEPGMLIDTNKCIGEMGNTGRLSEGRHLHWEYYRYENGSYKITNPIKGMKDKNDYWK